METKTIKYYEDEIKKLQENLLTDKEKLIIDYKEDLGQLYFTSSLTFLFVSLSIICISLKNMYFGVTMFFMSMFWFCLNNTGLLSRFVSFLTYKSKLIGKRVVENSEYKSSIRCCCCGTEKKMPLEIRTYECDNCGNKIDRDKNSSINIQLDYLSQNGLWMSYQQFVDNLRKTGLTIVRYSQETILNRSVTL